MLLLGRKGFPPDREGVWTGWGRHGGPVRGVCSTDSPGQHCAGHVRRSRVTIPGTSRCATRSTPPPDSRPQCRSIFGRDRHSSGCGGPSRRGRRRRRGLGPIPRVRPSSGAPAHDLAAHHAESPPPRSLSPLGQAGWRHTATPVRTAARPHQGQSRGALSGFVGVELRQTPYVVGPANGEAWCRHPELVFRVRLVVGGLCPDLRLVHILGR